MSIRRAVVVLVLLTFALIQPCLAAGRKPPRVNYRKLEAQIQVHNAARQDKGGRVSVDLIGPKTGMDRRAMAQQSADGNVHSRCVTWGVPIRFRIELVGKLPVSEINFIRSDYAIEETPKDVEIKLSDGTVIKKTLTAEKTKRGQYPRPRQRVPVGKDIAWVEVTVLSNHPGGLTSKGKRITWGGIGEIEVITTADLGRYLVVPDYDPKAPVYIRGASPRNDYSAIKVQMPAKIPLGEHPGIYLTRAEILKMREEIKKDPRAKQMMDKMIAGCDTWAAKKIVLPDPKVPAQMKDRGDAQARAHDLTSKMAGWLGWAYQLTDNEKYARTAREILVGYAKLYPNDYKEHKGVHGSDTSKVMAQRLSEAMWLIPLIQSYDLVYHAECMTAADRNLIETDLIRHAIRFINRKRPAKADAAARDRRDPDWRTTIPKRTRSVVGNWTNFYNAAYIQGGTVMGDQDWIDLGAANTRYNLVNGIGDDGMWGEGAIGYHLFGRQALVGCLEALARKGIDLYGMKQCVFKNLFDSPMKYAYPDGTAPGINDSGRASIGASWTAMAYDFAYLRYGDPNYGSIVNAAPRQVFQSAACYFPTVVYGKLPERPMAGLSSLVFDKLGYAILRGKDGGDTYLLMDYGPHGGGHGHPDKLNLILFADGDELAGEPQSFRYEDRRHADWTRPSIAHWTLSVDQHAQTPTTGKLLAFCDAGEIKAMRGQAAGAFAGVVLDRTVAQMPGYIVDVFRAWGPAKHTYDYPLCFRGALDALNGVKPAALKPMGLPTQRGYKHIRVTAPKKMGDSWTGVWRREAAKPNPDAKATDARRGGPANEVKVIVLGEKGSAVYTGLVPGDRQQAIIRRTGKEAVFAAVIDPYMKSDAVKAVERIEVHGPVRACGLKVTRSDGGTDIIVVRFDSQKDGVPALPSAFQGGKTDALVSVVRLDEAGKVLRLGMIGGTGLAAGGKTLRSAKPGIVFTGE